MVCWKYRKTICFVLAVVTIVLTLYVGNGTLPNKFLGKLNATIRRSAWSRILMYGETRPFSNCSSAVLKRFNRFPIPDEQCPDHLENCSQRVLEKNEAPKWIALWLPSEPEVDISHLTQIPGWKVVVVGDGVSPRGCRYPRCVFLDPESQAVLKSSLASLLPPNDLAKKNLAYLYAIKQRAEFIYDTHVNTRPLHNLNDFVNGNTSGLVYIGGETFNYYRHYGEHWFFPPGFVQLGEKDIEQAGYVLSDIPQPEVQYGLVTTNDNSQPRFQRNVPTVYVGSQAFAPFDSSNTMFHKRAFWGLFTFPGTRSDVYRSYILQSLLRYIHGYVGFLHPNAHQNNVLNVTEINETASLKSFVRFLYEWQCTNKGNLKTCFAQLASDLVLEHFLQKRCSSTIDAWLLDLNTFGYSLSDIPVKEPLKITAKTNKLSHKDSSSPIQFSATPSVYYKNNPNAKTYNCVSKICGQFKYPSNVSYQFDDILLIISFNYADFYSNIVFLEAIYRRYFPHILYCGPNDHKFRSSVNSKLPENSTVAFVTGVELGWMYFQECTVYAMKMNFNVKGYLQIGDDSLVNPWNLRFLPRERFWFNAKIRNASRLYSNEREWLWWPRSYGRTALNATFTYIENTAAKLGDTYEKRFFVQYMKNVKTFDSVKRETSDFFYIPHRFKEQFIYFTKLFFNSTVLVEAAVPTIMYGLDDKDNIVGVNAKVVWLEDRNNPLNHFNVSDHYLHAFKGIEQLKIARCKTFLCETYLPTLVERMDMY